MTPCIVFQLNKFYCKEIFEKLIYYLEKLELLNYPFHYENLEWIHDYYEDYMKRFNTFKENINFGKNTGKDTKQILLKNDSEF